MSENDKLENNEKRLTSKSEKNLVKSKQEYSKKIGNYVLLSEIGTGTFSKVAKAFHIVTDQEVAVKILEKEKIKDEIDIERILREIEILKKVIHPNICQLYETYSTVHNFYLMMEHIPGGDLFDYITNKNYLTEKKSCQFFRQLISVIEYLNELGISHRDIKPENILLDSNHEKIKLIDFGLSNYFTEKKLLKSSCGSPCYASPEMLSGSPYLGITTDLWSAGVVLYSMLVGSLPFDDQELYELYKQIKLGKFYLPSTLSLEAIDLLKKILVVDPKKRIGLEGIKKHKWFNMDGYPLYKGINLDKEKLGFNLEVINYVMQNYFGKENDLEYTSKKDFIEMIKNYYCNKYTAIYYLTKKYILKLDDDDYIFKKDEIKEKKEKNQNFEEKVEKSEKLEKLEKIGKNKNIKYDKKICKKNNKEQKIQEKKNYTNNNNYIIRNNINLEIKSEEKKKEDYNSDKNDNDKLSNIQDELENKEIILSAIDEPSDKKINSKNEFFKNNSPKQNKLNFDKKQNKNEEIIIKRNNKKNELYLNNIKNTNLKTHYRNSIEMKQKKFTKNLLLKGLGKTKDNLITNISNINNNPKYYINNSYIKTWGNNSINHISKNNKIAFINSNNSNNELNNNLNYNNYLCYNYNINNNNNNDTKKKHENSSSINSYKGSKKQKQNSKNHYKNKNSKNDNSSNNSYSNKFNNPANNNNNKYSLSSSKQKENNYNFYLINNYINQNDLKNFKNNANMNSINIGKIPNSTKNDDSADSNINFSQYYFVKARKYNMLKTIDLPGSYTSRYNTEMNNKKNQQLNNNLKPYNKIKVNLKADNNKLMETNSPKYIKNKKNIVTMNKKLSLDKNNNNNNNFSNNIYMNTYVNKSGRKKNSIIKTNIDEDKKLLNCLSVKNENSNSMNSNYKNNNINQNKNNKIQYQLYYLNESKPNSNNKLPYNSYGNILKNNVGTKGIIIKNNQKKIIRRNSSNSGKRKNNIVIKENTFSNNNSNNIIMKNIGKINQNDIYNKKKIKLDNNYTQKNNLKNYVFKELFSIEEDDKISDIKCHFNTRRIKNKILSLNEGHLVNKCKSPKEFYSFNNNGFLSYHSGSNIINNKKYAKENKMKQNLSNIYHRKKNLLIKTEHNSSMERTHSPQSTDNKIKYIYKSKLSLY